MSQLSPLVLSRRQMLAAGGGILVAFSTSALFADGAASRDAPNRPPPKPDELDSFIALTKEGTALALFGKIDPGQGVDLAIAQIVAEELDLPLDAVQVIQGDTAWTVNQGGASGSSGISMGGATLRFAAAEARRVLVDLAAKRLNVPVESLITENGRVVIAGSARSLSYADLLHDGFFETKLQWNGALGFTLASRGIARPKDPATYKIVGKPVLRRDIPHNVFAQQDYVTDIRLPGMLHARLIRPPVAGTEPISIDETSVAAIPGVRIFHEKAFVAVLAEKEWDAIRAAQALSITWSRPATPPFIAQTELYNYLRTAPTVQRQEDVVKGDMAGAIADAARIITASYEWPYQSHASLGGACALADVTDTGACVWSGTQKPHYARDGVAKLLGLDVAKVRCIWTRGPGSYGRNDAGDAVMDAAYLSRATGRPVRVQYMRDQGSGWDPKGPASVHTCKAALDHSGNVIGFQFESRGFSRLDVFHNESDPRDTLAGQLLGLGQHSTQGFGVPAEEYDFPHQLFAWETVPPLLANASPLRTSHLRDPAGPQISFASESFIDELAASTNADPVAYRLAHLAQPRSVAVIKAAAEAFGWTVRPANYTTMAADHETARGRGFAFAAHHTIVAAAVEVEVNRRTGEIRTLCWAVAHDCGLIVNPEGLRLTIEGNIVQATSRALMEEVTFSREAVTSVDWLSYPILDVSQVPERIDIVLLDHPDIPATGAGEAASRPVAAAIANAVFDAIGIRLRQAPFTSERVLAAIGLSHPS